MDKDISFDFVIETSEAYDVNHPLKDFDEQGQSLAEYLFNDLSEKACEFNSELGSYSEETEDNRRRAYFENGAVLEVNFSDYVPDQEYYFEISSKGINDLSFMPDDESESWEDYYDDWED